MILLDYSIDELTEIFISNNIPKFRAKQVYGWLQKGYATFDEMPNIPKELRSTLSEKYETGIPEIVDCLESRLDETRKYLLKFSDDNIIEAVLMKYKHGYSICISSQIGCRMGCKFCASTGLNFVRNLTAGEMLGEVVAVSRDSGVRISNIVLMGIGEPFDNFDNFVKFIRLVNDENGLNIGQRHITVSTCGLVDRINDFTDMNMQVNLSISLHATSDDARSEIMPINRKYNIKQLLSACRNYVSKTNRRITFEYALIKGINDSPYVAEQIANLLKGMLCHVNLIPVNEVKDSGFCKSDKKTIDSFLNILTRSGIPATVRRELGADIAAACGQLRRNNIETIEK